MGRAQRDVLFISALNMLWLGLQRGLSAKGRARERKIELVPRAGGCTG